ncbi:unnamed protein product [Parascedosporium putredinis]|uniref:Uncharacterized protein n=1 Tax=Parascedosporium putredinis TaxID=1442378 RepID=A0A9P1H4P4_9PEZI|nr:unnamed protein product [Parascedosporium putredinis]CAI7996938.1 unnamed protein product [Parascedosporium putredinis]
MPRTCTFPTYNLEKSVLEGWLSQTFNDQITADVINGQYVFNIPDNRELTEVMRKSIRKLRGKMQWPPKIENV